MRKIIKPETTVREVLIDCISNMSDPVLKQELTDAIDEIEVAETEFETKKKSNELHLIEKEVAISKTIDTKVLKSIYTDRMVNKKNLGRNHYDKIFLSAPNGKCPLCFQRIVTTLDHYLPKSLYPLLAVTPINLVPACTDCNKGKLIDCPTCSEEETLHPYYDNVEDERWLKMKLLKLNPIIFDFYVDAPIAWDDLIKSRLVSHFKSFSLNDLYKTHASEEFENIRLQLTKLFTRGGQNLLEEHLLDCLESRETIFKNSWQVAFYEGLLDSEDFCAGKFLN